MTPANTLSLRMVRQIWIVRTLAGATRYHLFFRPTMGTLIAVAIGNETFGA